MLPGSTCIDLLIIFSQLKGWVLSNFRKHYCFQWIEGLSRAGTQLTRIILSPLTWVIMFLWTHRHESRRKTRADYGYQRKTRDFQKVPMHFNDLGKEHSRMTDYFLILRMYVEDSHSREIFLKNSKYVSKISEVLILLLIYIICLTFRITIFTLIYLLKS